MEGGLSKDLQSFIYMKKHVVRQPFQVEKLQRIPSLDLKVDIYGLMQKLYVILVRIAIHSSIV